MRPFLLLAALLVLPGCDAVSSILDSLSAPSAEELNGLTNQFGCEVEGLSGSRNGRLALGDCTLSVDNSLIDLYAFRVSSDSRVRVTLTSDDFAPYLIVYNEFATPLVEEDAGGGSVAEASFDVNDGLFVIGANSESGGVTGEYTVRVERL